MASYTMTLQEVIDYGYDLRLGKEYVELFDEDYRETFKKRIIDHFRFQEIGFETPEMFIFHLGRKLREIMPIYNRLYKSALKDYDPTMTTDLTTTVDSLSNSHSESIATGKHDDTSESKSKSRTVSADLPQLMLRGDADYATAGSDAISESSTNGKGTTDGTSKDDSKTDGKMTSRALGRSGDASALIMSYRQALISVDLMLCRELQPLFMQLFEVNDNIFPNQGTRNNSVLLGLYRYL